LQREIPLVLALTARSLDKYGLMFWFSSHLMSQTIA
jgi:hypothetical protein